MSEHCKGCEAGLELKDGMHFDPKGVYACVCSDTKARRIQLGETVGTLGPGSFVPYWTKGHEICRPDPYATLRKVFADAVLQAEGGKGKERHATEGEAFEDQKICEIRKRVGSGYTLGQAIKKCIESKRLPKDRAIAELLGAINYIAAEVICRGDEEEA